MYQGRQFTQIPCCFQHLSRSSAGHYHTPLLEEPLIVTWPAPCQRTCMQKRVGTENTDTHYQAQKAQALGRQAITSQNILTECCCYARPLKKPQGPRDSS